MKTIYIFKTKKVHKEAKKGVIFGLLLLGIVACSSNGSNIKSSTSSEVVARKVVSSPSVVEGSSQSCQTPLHETLGLQWSNGTTIYKGVMNLKGCKGSLLVSFWDEALKRTAKVRQDIKISNTSLGIMLYGFNPVYPGTSKPYPQYAADNFLFQQKTDGTLISFVCDDVKQCSPISFFTP